MSDAWRAEQLVDEERARRLIRRRFPELGASVEAVSEGWDYAVFRVDRDWAFRFPRRAEVVPGTERELVVLPLLEPLLPVAVPVPVHVGRPAADYPWPFYGARFLPGAEPDAALGDERRTALARPLARALRSLHGPEVLAAAGRLLPFDPIRRVDMPFRAERAREALAALGETPGRTERLFAEALRLPPPEPLAVVHGDLHVRQLLVAGGELTGIVDWVDVCRSEPAADLSLAWSFLPPQAREEFLDEYGPVSAATAIRARVFAVFVCAILTRWARAGSRPALEAEARAGLERALDE